MTRQEPLLHAALDSTAGQYKHIPPEARWFTLAANLFGDDVQEHGRVAADLGVRVRLLLLVMPVQRPGKKNKKRSPEAQ
jgi:hypothetical protein